MIGWPSLMTYVEKHRPPPTCADLPSRRAAITRSMSDSRIMGEPRASIYYELEGAVLARKPAVPVLWASHDEELLVCCGASNGRNDAGWHASNDVRLPVQAGDRNVRSALASVASSRSAGGPRTGTGDAPPQII